jgi:hypothetical protein
MFKVGDIVRKGDRSFKVAGVTERSIAHGWAFKGPSPRRFASLVHVVAGYGTKTARVLTFSADKLQMAARHVGRAA